VIGILGGTFDPVHVAHLRCALEVQQILRLGEIRFIPARQPPHRPPPLASPAQRLAMLRLAAGDQPGFAVDERELRREGPSYTVDTLRSLRAELGAARPLCLLLGIDAFAGLDGWHEWQSLAELAHLVVMRRPGVEPALSPAVRALLEDRVAADHGRLRQGAAGCVALLTVTQLDVSATRVRELIAAGGSVRYLVPDRVLDFIHREGLYRGAALHATGLGA
jgi:nicotinate-nucleotide adenylyltransferase